MGNHVIFPLLEGEDIDQAFEKVDELNDQECGPLVEYSVMHAIYGRDILTLDGYLREEAVVKRFV